MSKMTPLPSGGISHAIGELELTVVNAGLLSDGVRADIKLFNGTVRMADCISLSSKKDRQDFAKEAVKQGLVTDASVVDKALLELKDQVDGVLAATAAKASENTGDSKDKPGRALESCVYIPTPHDAPVDGNSLACQIKETFERHVVLSPGASTALAIWTIFTYCLEAFDSSPMIFLYSPLPQCGKSRVLMLIQSICYKGLMAASITSAGFFRTIEALAPTLTLDEIDTYLRDREELRGIINSGHDRALAHVIRVDGESMEPRTYSTWCPKALAGIGLKSLAEAPRSRSIKIEMQKKTKAQKVVPLRYKTLMRYQREISHLCLRWAQDNLEALSEANPELPDALVNRAEDNWEPLLAIAEAIGGDWPQLVKDAISKLEREEVDDGDIKLTLLHDLRTLFDEHGTPLGSKFITEHLVKIEESPWAAYSRNEKPITQTQLARLLKPFGISSNTVRPIYSSETSRDRA